MKHRAACLRQLSFLFNPCQYKLIIGTGVKTVNVTAGYESGVVSRSKHKLTVGSRP